MSFDDTGNFTWSNNNTTTNGNFFINSNTGNNFAFTVNGTSYHPVIPDKNWMPYRYFEYDPKWHKKYARYKIQMSSMWN